MKVIPCILLTFVSSLSFSQNANWEWARTIGASIDDDIERSVELYGCKIALDSKGNSYVAGLFSDTIHFNGTEISAISGNREVDMFLAKYGPNGEAVWMKSFGSKGTDFIMGIAIDNNDNIFVTGGYDGILHVGDSTITGRGEVDGFLVSYTSTGQLRLLTGFGSEEDDLPTDIASDGTNIYISGGCFGQHFYYHNLELSDKSFFILKLNTNGTAEWASNLNQNGAYIKPMQITPDHTGGCYISGELAKIVIGNDTIGTDVYNRTSLIHITSAGVADWVRVLDNCDIVSIVANSTSVCVLANFQDSVIIGDSIYQSPLMNKSTPSLLTGIYNKDGSFRSVFFSNGTSHVGYDVCTDSLQRFIISGRCGRVISFGDLSDTIETINSSSGFVTRIDANGEVSLLMTIPTIPTVFLTSVASNSQNEIGVVGFYRDSIRVGNTSFPAVSSDPDILVAKIGEKSSVQNKRNSFENNKVFPNPASTVANINFILPSPSTVTITLHDILGREVLRREMGMQPEGEHEESLDVSKLSAGSYIIRISTNGEVFTSRISVVR